MKRSILVISLSLLCFVSKAQDKTNNAKSRFSFCQNLLSSERMLLLALQHGDYVKQRMFLSEANLAAMNAHLQFQQIEGIEKVLTQGEIEDLKMCLDFLQKETSKDDFTPSEPATIALWAMLADNKLAVIIPKIL